MIEKIKKQIYYIRVKDVGGRGDITYYWEKIPAKSAIAAAKRFIKKYGVMYYSDGNEFEVYSKKSLNSLELDSNECYDIAYQLKLVDSY